SVNPRHREVLGKPSYASLADIGKPIDLALVAVPAASVMTVLDDCRRVGVRAAVVLSAPPIDSGEAQGWQQALAAFVSSRTVRVLGPYSFGVVRTEIGLNATASADVPHRGRLALIAQSGAVCSALLAFAATAGFGFSSVVALGGAVDIGFAELL